jgi:hypothetical protein
MDKQRLQLNSVHQIGLEIPVYRVLIVVGSGTDYGEVSWAAFWKSENWEHFCLWGHSQLCYDKIEAAIGLSASERSKNTFPWDSDSRWWWSLARVKLVGRNFENRNIGNVFACAATTSNATTKWMAPLDSAHRIGLKATLTNFLTLVVMRKQVVKKSWWNFLAGGIWDAFACGAVTNGVMVKWRQPIDSAGQIGPETVEKSFLILGWRATTEQRKGAGRILKIGILELFLTTMPQPAILRQNECYYWIQLVK